MGFNGRVCTLKNVWDEQVWTFLAVLFPVLTVLLLALGIISQCSVQKNHEEENREEPWERTFETTCQTPDQRLSPVSGVVDFSCQLVPSINQQV